MKTIKDYNGYKIKIDSVKINKHKNEVAFNVYLDDDKDLTSFHFFGFTDENNQPFTKFYIIKKSGSTEDTLENYNFENLLTKKKAAFFDLLANNEVFRATLKLHLFSEILFSVRDPWGSVA